MYKQSVIRLVLLTFVSLGLSGCAIFNHPRGDEGTEGKFPSASPYSGYNTPEPAGGLRERHTPTTGNGRQAGG